MTRDLMALRVWLLEVGVTHVGMEGTGVYWQPVHAALEGSLTVIVGNTAHMRHVPGRKTDYVDGPVKSIGQNKKICSCLRAAEVAYYQTLRDSYAASFGRMFFAMMANTNGPLSGRTSVLR